MEPVLNAQAAKMWATTPELQRRRMLDWASKLGQDPFLGEQIRKDRFPRSMRALANLWRLPLPEGWRALYTVTGLGENTTQVVIVWIGNHKEYDRLFGYHTS